MEDKVSSNTKSEEVFITRWSRRSLYPALFVLALLVRLACYTGLIASKDDLQYSYFAQLISQGAYASTFNVTAHTGMRLGVTVPTGMIYWLFGVSEFTTIVLPLLTSSALVVLLAEIGTRLFSRRVGLISALWLVTFPVEIRHATILIPEPMMEFWVLLGVLLFLIGSNRSSLRSGVFAGLCFGVAYLTKEAGIFVGAALIVYCVLQRKWKLALTVASSMAAVGLLELMYYHLITGDAMYRSHVIAATQETYLQETEGGEVSLAWRLFKEYPYEMLLPNIDFGLHSLIALILAAYGAIVLRGRIVLFLFLWATIPFLYLNFGTVSFVRYLPSFAAPRYIMQVYFPLFLLAAAAMDRWLSSTGPQRYTVLPAFSLIAILGVSCAFAIRGQGYSTDAVSSLRAIASKAAKNKQKIAAFEGSNRKRWAAAMSILSRSMGKADNCTTECLTVQPDALGLPFSSPYLNKEPLPNENRGQGLPPAPPFSLEK